MYISELMLLTEKPKLKEQHCNSFAQFDSTVWLHTGGTEA